MRRAAVSIPANIAEGSAGEWRYYLILSRGLDYGEIDAVNSPEEASRLLNGYMRALFCLLTPGSF